MNKGDHVLNGVLLAVGTGVLLGIVPSVGPGAAERTLPAAPVDAAIGVAALVAQFFVPVVLGALFPDVDTAFGRHRKSLHNLFVLGAFVAYPLVFDNLHYVWLGVLSHFVLDMAGSARGIALFYPLSTTEYDLPGGVPVSSRYATPVTVLITLGELALMTAVHYYLVPLDTDGTALRDVTTRVVGPF